MSAPIVLLFADDPYQAAPPIIDGAVLANAHQPGLSATAELRSRGPLILLAVGPEGGAALARWVAEHGLDGVAGIGLVGVTAPWAERFLLGLPEEIYNDGPDYEGEVWPPMPEYSRLPLGPLEGLRTVAERARVGEPCAAPRCTGNFEGPNDRTCEVCGDLPINTIRLVVACAPDDGVCNCKWKPGSGYSNQADGVCPECAGTGKALSSADVALELSDERRLYEGIDDFEATTGGMTTIHYPTSAALDEHGLRAVVERLTRDAEAVNPC